MNDLLDDRVFWCSSCDKVFDVEDLGLESEGEDCICPRGGDYLEWQQAEGKE